MAPLRGHASEETRGVTPYCRYERPTSYSCPENKIMKTTKLSPSINLLHSSERFLSWLNGVVEMAQDVCLPVSQTPSERGRGGLEPPSHPISGTGGWAAILHWTSQHGVLLLPQDLKAPSFFRSDAMNCSPSPSRIHFSKEGKTRISTRGVMSKSRTMIDSVRDAVFLHLRLPCRDQRKATRTTGRRTLGNIAAAEGTQCSMVDVSVDSLQLLCRTITTPLRGLPGFRVSGA